jgi:DNA-binding transcriptional regulator YiaG
MKKEYASEALMVCHQSAESLLRLGIIDTDEMKEFDEGCFVQESETAHETENHVEMEHTTPVTA